MARSTFDVKEEYLGNGMLDTYSFDFKIEAANHLLIVVIDNLGEKQYEIRGDDVVYLSDITFDNVNGGGTITLVNVLANNWKLILLLANDEPTQPYEFINKGSFTLKRFELALDFLGGAIQRLAYLFTRAVTLDESVASFNPKLPLNIHLNPNSALIVNPTGDGFVMGPNIIGLAGDFIEVEDDTDYTLNPILQEYAPDSNKVVFNGGGITELRSIVAGVPGRRLMLLNAQGTTIDIPNMDAGEPDGTRILTGSGQTLEWFADTTLFLNYTNENSCWHIVGGSGSGAGVLLGLPTDGTYGGPIGPIAGIEVGDRMEDALDKVDTILGLLAPEPPAALSAKTLLVTGSYDALEATTGTAHPVVVNDTTPEITPGTAVTFANSFRDGKAGVLSAEMDAVEVGSITLTTGDDTGIDGELEIIDDFDPYFGTFGQEGFWAGLIARINSAALSVGQHIAELIHSTTGTASVTFYVDDAVAPSSSSRVLSSSGSSSFRSGVPGVAQGQTINVAFDAVNCVKTHYNSTRIGRATCTQTNSANAALPGSPPAPDATVPISINLTVADEVYSENVSANCLVYNSAGTSVSNAVTATNNIRVDTVGDESIRVISGTGQYPASGYGGAFDSSVSLATASNFELQYLNGIFQDPPAVDYSSKYPVGPNYSALSYDSHNSMRWATFSLGSVSAVTSVTFTIAGAVNFGATALVSGIELYVRVDGATPTTGWIDANAAYPGVGNPTANGDAALDVGASTSTSKRVTFGASVKTGTVYVRIGIPDGSNKTFTGIS